MQIVVLGMHRSGTSMLTKLICQLGVFCGDPEDLIGTNQENPKGFWERQDIRDLNDSVIKGMGCDWDRVSNFSADLVSDEQKEQFASQANSILAKLDQNAPWVIKEPRLCLLLDLWASVLTKPVYIHVFRNPLEVAASLEVRNGIPKSVGIALWELYNRNIVSHLKGVAHVRVSHKDLLENPFKAMTQIYQHLQSKGAEVQSPSREDIENFIDPSLYRQKYNDTE